MYDMPALVDEVRKITGWDKVRPSPPFIQQDVPRKADPPSLGGRRSASSATRKATAPRSSPSRSASDPTSAQSSRALSRSLRLCLRVR